MLVSREEDRDEEKEERSRIKPKTREGMQTRRPYQETKWRENLSSSSSASMDRCPLIEK